ncbi:uncharacterized protein G2W53_042446 [Senna tora]|uniref:Uncharacterized protein n=1 Tax=Senna tora TaxID=362788 RepID=A0A834SFF4_9FABA|nr:uncharacterized protein G2W53_042446 [Senna tora]
MEVEEKSGGATNGQSYVCVIELHERFVSNREAEEEEEREHVDCVE